MLTPPSDVKVHDMTITTAWFDEDGILYAVSKKGVGRTMENARKTLEGFKKLLDGSRVCLLVDSTYSSQTPREIRDYVAEEFPHMFKAIAIISGSALGKMVANIFFTIKKPAYPIKIFNNENEAKKWLKQYV